MRMDWHNGPLSELSDLLQSIATTPILALWESVENGTSSTLSEGVRNWNRETGRC